MVSLTSAFRSTGNFVISVLKHPLTSADQRPFCFGFRINRYCGSLPEMDVVMPNSPVRLRNIFSARFMHWVYLIVSIISEVTATSALKVADGFTRLWPSLLVVAGYSSSFYFLSLTLRSFPLGVVYAIWSGVGVALITLAGWALYQQRLDAGALVGIALIVAGVIVLNLFSKSVML